MITLPNNSGLIVLPNIISSIINENLAVSQNDYNNLNLPNTDIIFFNPTATVKVTGINAQRNGKILKIFNSSTDFLLIFTINDTNSAVNNRLLGPAIPIFLFPDDGLEIIYDTSVNKWRVLEASHGKDFNQFEFYTDGLDFPSTTAGYFRAIANGAGAVVGNSNTGANTVERAIGNIDCNSGTTAAGNAYLATPSSSGLSPVLGPYLFLSRVNVNTLSTLAERFQPFIGLHDAAAGTNTTDGIYWTYRDEVNANWLFSVASAGVRTENPSSKIVVAGEFIWLGFFVNGLGTRADYFLSSDSVNWLIEGSIAAGLPTVAQMVAMSTGINKTLGVTPRILSIDFEGIRFATVRG